MAWGEDADEQVDRFIELRHDARVAKEGERPAHEAYVPSLRELEKRRSEAQAAEKFWFHLDHARRLRKTLGALVEQHEALAERYCWAVSEVDLEEAGEAA